MNDALVTDQQMRARQAVLERRIAESTGNEQRHRQVFECLPVPCLVLTPDGLISDGNLAAAQLLGSELRFLPGKPLIVLLRSDQHGLFYTHRQRVLEGRQGRATCELLLHRRDGEEYPVRFDSVALPERNGSRTILCSLTDLRERHLAEHALEVARHSVEDMAKAKATLMDNMTHELRTPLNGIIGMLQLLEMDLKDPGHLDIAQTALGAARSLHELVNNILDFSRLEAGYGEMDSVPCAIAAIAEEALATIGPQANAKQLQAVLELDPALPERLLGDPQRLRQVMINLLGNAVKFTARGFISLELSVEPQEGRGDLLLIAVRDSGPGIPADRVKRIFERFEQGDMSMTRAHGGSGLGLALVREIVRRMGGLIQVDSEVGFGSCFSMRFPLQRLETVATVPPEQPPVGTWILGDDRELTRRNLATTLTRLRIPVVQALDLAEARRLADQHDAATILVAGHLLTAGTPEASGGDPRIVSYGPHPGPGGLMTPLVPSRIDRLVRERARLG